MPVTIKPSPEAVGRNRDPTVKSAQQLYSRLVAAWEKDVHHGQPNTKRTKPVLHSSFENLSSNGEAMFIPYGNGFVEGVMRAFQQDLHLVVRPDDVWLSILTQFSFYASAHSEELRHKFVSHQGNETLVVANNARPFHSWDVGHMAQMIIPLLKEKMADKTVHDWLIPVFSTSTELDLAVSSMVMMATMKDYFSLDKFAEYGQEPAAWSKLLKPVIKRFVATFYLPDSMELKEFWMQALHAEGKFGSGPSPTYNGWLTALMYWDKEGNCMANGKEVDAKGKKQLKLDGDAFPILKQDKRGVPTGDRRSSSHRQGARSGSGV